MTEYDNIVDGAPESLGCSDESERIARAKESFERAYRLQMEGNLLGAAELYQQSIAMHATAAAHTFLGWVYSMMGRLEEAIEECHLAIAIDPDFGNPYNDIGAYLIELGRYHEATPWLKRAIDAPRYECPFYPHFNLGRVHENWGEPLEAIHEYSLALELNPRYTLAVKAVRRLQSMLN